MRPDDTPASSRLRAAASLVPPGSAVADVGTDAAALPLMLLDAATASRCVATDRSAAALQLARRRGRRHLEAGRLELRHGAGLACLRAGDALDVLVICGMGARTMLDILDDPRLETLGLRRLVLQPQTEPALARRFLLERGFGIVAERLARDRGHDYVAIAAEPGAQPACEGDLELLLEAGPCLLASADPLVLDHWRRESRRNEQILARAAAGRGRARALRRRDVARRALARLGRNAGAAERQRQFEVAILPPRQTKPE